MAYLSLYRKYRSQTFDELLGQEHVSRTLSNAIAEDRVAHAYLFTGPRGTGKTSTARILAKALNCEKGPTPNPCGVCDSCVAITQGSSLDVIELDAASHSGVDDTRDILAGVQLATAGSRVKVYVIDEVHMLTTPSFNALLKTLEEPPPHVVFILATTEAHKVLQTIQSRTQRFDFRPISTDVLHRHVAEIAKQEGIDVDDEGLGAIARHAEGSARDALSILDQLASFGGPVSAADVERLLGGRTEEAYSELFNAIASGDIGGVFWSLHTLIAEGADARQLADGALRHARSLLLLATAPEAEDLLDFSVEDRAALSSQAGRFSPAALLRTMDLIATARTDMRESPNHRLLLEVALVRATAPETDPSSLGLLGRIERLERRIGVDGAAPPASVETTGGVKQPVERDQSATEVTPRPAPSEPAVSPQQRAPTHVEAEPPPAPAEVGLGHVKEAWAATLREVSKRSKRVAAYLHASRPVEYDGGVLAVEVQSDFHAGAMNEAPNRSLVIEALQSALGIAPQVAFGTRANPPTAEDVDGGEHEIAADGPDPVELVKKGFGAEIVEES